MRLLLRSLRYRNYRLFFGGQSLSLIGTWMQRMAVSWLVYRMTGSAFLLGVVGFAGQIPSFVFSPFAGVLADRLNRHRLLMVTQATAMAQALLLAFLVLNGHIAVWHIVLLSLLLGVVNSFDAPVRQAFLIEMIDNREDLGNAIALNSSMVNGARMIGPSIAGFMIAFVGEGLCFLVNAVSYAFVILALWMMRLRPPAAKGQDSGVLHRLAEGFRYAFGFLPIRGILLLLALTSLMGMPVMVLMPVFARDILHGGPETLGFLMMSFGAGSLMGALLLATRRTVLGLGKVIARASALFGAVLVVFSFSRVLWLSMALLLAGGFGVMLQMASSNTVLQAVVDDDKRGRVMSFYAVSFLGMAPLGSLLAGWLTTVMGAPNTILMGGTCCLGGAFLFHRRLPEMKRWIRPVYIQKGIIPEVAVGIRAATETVPPPDTPNAQPMGSGLHS